MLDVDSLQTNKTQTPGWGLGAYAAVRVSVQVWPRTALVIRLGGPDLHPASWLMARSGHSSQATQSAEGSGGRGELAFEKETWDWCNDLFTCSPVDWKGHLSLLWLDSSKSVTWCYFVLGLTLCGVIKDRGGEDQSEPSYLALSELDSSALPGCRTPSPGRRPSPPSPLWRLSWVRRGLEIGWETGRVCVLFTDIFYWNSR